MRCVRCSVPNSIPRGSTTIARRNRREVITHSNLYLNNLASVQPNRRRRSEGKGGWGRDSVATNHAASLSAPSPSPPRSTTLADAECVSYSSNVFESSIPIRVRRANSSSRCCESIRCVRAADDLWVGGAKDHQCHREKMILVVDGSMMKSWVFHKEECDECLHSVAPEIINVISPSCDTPAPLCGCAAYNYECSDSIILLCVSLTKLWLMTNNGLWEAFNFVMMHPLDSAHPVCY